MRHKAPEPGNFDYVKELGASQVFDYNQKDVVKDIIEAFKGKTCAGALAIVAGSAEPCSAIVAACDGNKFVSLAGPPASLELNALAHLSGLRLPLLLLRVVSESITMRVKFWLRRTRTKSIFGSTLVYNEVSKVVYEDFLPQALAEGRYAAAPQPVVVGSRIDHIQAGLDAQRQGVSAQKVVVSL